MKVVCINNTNDRFTESEVDVGHPVKLTIGKVYTTLNDSKDWNWMGVKMVNDNGQTKFYDKMRFQSLEEWRQVNCMFTLVKNFMPNFINGILLN